MKSDQGSVDDLLVLARRGDLSEGDERRLREQLASSPEARLLYQAGRAFDAEAPVQAGDDERLERIVNMGARFERGPGVARSTVRRRWIVLGGLAAALVGGVAVAAVTLTRPPSRVPEPPAATTTTVTAPPASAAPVPSPEPAPSVTALAAPSPVPLPVPMPMPTAPGRMAPTPPESVQRTTSNAPAPPGEPPSAPTSPAPVTASELFSAANRARVGGDTQEAIRLSQQLETQFPTSREAIATHLSLGLLYLQQGEPGAALEQFRSTRALGAASPEAIWGESQALRQLGRTDEERAALGELLRAYPKSAYSAAAQKRLSDLQ